MSHSLFNVFYPSYDGAGTRDVRTGTVGRAAAAVPHPPPPHPHVPVTSASEDANVWPSIQSTAHPTREWQRRMIHVRSPPVAGSSSALGQHASPNASGRGEQGEGKGVDRSSGGVPSTSSPSRLFSRSAPEGTTVAATQPPRRVQSSTVVSNSSPSILRSPRRVQVFSSPTRVPPVVVVTAATSVPVSSSSKHAHHPHKSTPSARAGGKRGEGKIVHAGNAGALHSSSSSSSSWSSPPPPPHRASSIRLHRVTKHEHQAPTKRSSSYHSRDRGSRDRGSRDRGSREHVSHHATRHAHNNASVSGTHAQPLTEGDRKEHRVLLSASTSTTTTTTTSTDRKSSSPSAMPSSATSILSTPRLPLLSTSSLAAVAHGHSKGRRVSHSEHASRHTSRSRSHTALARPSHDGHSHGQRHASHQQDGGRDTQGPRHHTRGRSHESPHRRTQPVSPHVWNSETGGASSRRHTLASERGHEHGESKEPKSMISDLGAGRRMVSSAHAAAFVSSDAVQGGRRHTQRAVVEDAEKDYTAVGPHVMTSIRGRHAAGGEGGARARSSHSASPDDGLTLSHKRVIGALIAAVVTLSILVITQPPFLRAPVVNEDGKRIRNKHELHIVGAGMIAAFVGGVTWLTLCVTKL